MNGFMFCGEVTGPSDLSHIDTPHRPRHETLLQTIHRFTIGFHNHGEGPWLKATSFLNMVLRDQNVTQLLYISGAFNQEKAQVGAFPVIVQLCRLIVCSTTRDADKF